MLSKICAVQNCLQKSGYSPTNRDSIDSMSINRVKNSGKLCKYLSSSTVYLLLNLLISAARFFILLERFCLKRCFVLMTKCDSYSDLTMFYLQYKDHKKALFVL